MQPAQQAGEHHEHEVKAEPVGFAEDYEVLIEVSDEEPNEARSGISLRRPSQP